MEFLVSTNILREVTKVASFLLSIDKIPFIL